MTAIFGKVARAMLTVTMPYQYGFVRGHPHLHDGALQSIKQVLDSNDAIEGGKTLLRYETLFARLVGDGFAVNFASARMAFYALMKVLGIGSGDEVILPAFTCAVMPHAVMRTGARPVYADIDRNTLGSDAQAIERVITNRTKLIVAQHSFGIPCNIREIVELARRQSIYAVEDCAIALDSSLQGVTVGNWGDAAFFSTDHTKPINTVVGGLLYTRNKAIFDKVADFSRTLPSLSTSHQQRLYQQLVSERQIGDPKRYPRIQFHTKTRILFDRLRRSKRTIFLEDDFGDPETAAPAYPYPARMPPFLARLGLFELERWQDEKLQRKQVLAGFLNAVEQSSWPKQVPQAYRDGARDITPLRFAFTSPEKERLLSELDNMVDANGIWFQQPVIGVAKGLKSVGYAPGSCRVAEQICSEIINLPCAIEAEWFRLLEHRLRAASPQAFAMG